MKQFKFLTLVVLASSLLVACSSKTEGKPEEVLSKSAYKNVIAQYDDVWNFHEGMAKVRKGAIFSGTFGFIDTKGKEVVECIYESADQFTGGLCAVEKDDMYGFIDKKGEIVVPIIYKEVGSFSGKLAPVALPQPERTWNEIWGYIDKKGEVVVPIENASARNFYEGLARLKKKDKVGYINEEGKYAIEPIFTSGYDFSEGLAVVEKGNKEMVINTKGDVVYTLSDKMIFTSWAEYHDGFITVKKLKGRSWWNDEDVKAGFLDKEGNEAISCIYDDVEDFKNGVAYVEKDDRHFYINTKGEEVEAPDEE